MLFILICCYIWKVVVVLLLFLVMVVFVLFYSVVQVWYHILLDTTVWLSDKLDDKHSHPDTLAPVYFS